jgi:hypothetical protein
MAVTRTQDQFARRVLDKMGLTNVMEDSDGKSLQTVKTSYIDVLEELREEGDEGLVFWDDDAIPASVVRPLTDLVILDVGSSFGYALPPVEERELQRELLLRGIRKQVQKKTTKKPLRVEYF